MPGSTTYAWIFRRLLCACQTVLIRCHCDSKNSAIRWRAGGVNPPVWRRTWGMTAPAHRAPQLIGVEIVVVEIDGSYQPVVVVILDLVAFVVVGDDEHRQLPIGIEVDQAASAAGEIRLDSGWN